MLRLAPPTPAGQVGRGALPRRLEVAAADAAGNRKLKTKTIAVKPDKKKR
jgi:hypothetical protein